MVAVLMGIVAVLLAALLAVAVDAAGGWRRVRPATAADEAQARWATGAAGLDPGGWRIRTVADILQLVLVVALGLTPLGARFVHLVAPKGDAWHGAAAWLLILAAVLSLALWVTVGLLVLIWEMRIRRLPQSERLSALASSLPGGPRARVVSGWLVGVANAATASVWRPVIWVAPPIAAALTDRELRAVLAHEAGHVRHRDVRRQARRRFLIVLCVVAAMVALHGIAALRSLAGLQDGLSVQAGPFLLAVGYLVFRVLYAMELRANRAEERAADREMISLTGDPDACVDGLGKLSSLLGIPDAWTLPQRLLFATHPATSERLSLLRDPVPVADVQPRMPAAGRRVLACWLVLGAAVAAIAAADVWAIRMPADAGKYRLLLPRSFDTAPLNTTSTDAVQLRSSVWGSGDLGRFPGAVPVTAVYDQNGQSWLYVWGAYGKLADPSGELSAFWNKFDAAPLGLTVGFPDAEPAGPLGGYLQCNDVGLICAWADDSGIVVVSLSPPQSGVNVWVSPPVTEQQLAAMTRSLRAAAEVLAKPEHTAS
jgi:hypothetical protein